MQQSFFGSRRLQIRLPKEWYQRNVCFKAPSSIEKGRWSLLTHALPAKKGPQQVIQH